MYCGSVDYCGSNLLKLLKIDDYVDPKQRSEIVHRGLRNVEGVANLVARKRAVPTTDHYLHLSLIILNKSEKCLRIMVTSSFS